MGGKLTKSQRNCLARIEGGCLQHSEIKTGGDTKLVKGLRSRGLIDYIPYQERDGSYCITDEGRAELLRPTPTQREARRSPYIWRALREIEAAPMMRGVSAGWGPYLVSGARRSKVRDATAEALVCLGFCEINGNAIYITAVGRAALDAHRPTGART